MDWKQIGPYLLPLLVAAILARRMMRAQKPRTVRLGRLWLLPALLLFATWTTLAHEELPGIVSGIVSVLVFVVATALGGLIGWFRVHTLEFTRDAGTGKITSRGSQLDVLFVVGLIAVRYGRLRLFHWRADRPVAKCRVGLSYRHNHVSKIVGEPF